MLELTKRTLKQIATLAFVVSTVCGAIGAAQNSLGSYNVNIKETSVSGISSGADMAVQFAVAHSSNIKGVGALAGGPYYCAQDDVNKATGSCMIGAPPDVMLLKQKADDWAKQGEIDSTSNLAAQKVWILSGYNDGVVKTPVVDALVKFYSLYSDSKAGNIYYKNDLPAAHAQLTSWSKAQACNVTGGDFMDNCNYDAAGLILQHSYGTLNPRKTGTLSGKVIEFRQSEFFSGSSSSIGMDETAYVYVPNSCAHQEPCRVHIAFHGCGQNAKTIGSDFYEHAGYNEWADSNNMIVLYPQTKATSYSFGLAPTNPLGCWDWWGYTDSNYAQKDGRQIMAVEKMLERLAEKYTGSQSTLTGAFGSPKSLVALDSSPSRVALAWTPVPGAEGYNVYRARKGDTNCPDTTKFKKVNDAIIQGSSYADSGLMSKANYCYFVKAVHNKKMSAASAVVSRRTAGEAPACDPYFRSVYMHWQEDRSHMGSGFSWYKTYANGSNEYVGDVGPSSLSTWVLLTRTGPGVYVVGRPCEPASKIAGK